MRWLELLYRYNIINSGDVLVVGIYWLKFYYDAVTTPRYFFTYVGKYKKVVVQIVCKYHWSKTVI